MPWLSFARYNKLESSSYRYVERLVFLMKILVLASYVPGLETSASNVHGLNIICRLLGHLAEDVNIDWKY